jgi:hypothetical protein
MDIESLKKIEFAQNLKREKFGSFFFQKKKKSKPPRKEEGKQQKIDVRA